MDRICDYNVLDRKAREAAMSARKLKLVGWGYEGEGITDAERQMAVARFRDRFAGEFEMRPAPSISAQSCHRGKCLMSGDVLLKCVHA